jgi:hypothetical protein
LFRLVGLNVDVDLCWPGTRLGWVLTRPFSSRVPTTKIGGRSYPWQWRPVLMHFLHIGRSLPRCPSL